MNGLDVLCCAWHAALHDGVACCGTWQSATESAAAGVGHANGPSPPQAAFTSTQTCPLTSRMAHGRVAGTPAGAVGRAPTSKATASMSVGVATQVSGPVVACAGAKQGS